MRAKTVSGLRHVRCALPTFKELRQVTPFSLRHWFYRITAVRYPVGIILEYLGNEDENGSEQAEKKE